MDTALRVLMAVVECRNPDPADVQALKDYAGIDYDIEADLLACHIVQKASAECKEAARAAERPKKSA